VLRRREDLCYKYPHLAAKPDRNLTGDEDAMNEPQETRMDLAAQIERILEKATDRDGALTAAVQAVHESSDRYDWTGIYLLEGEELVLHNYLGAPSPHTRIPVGKGICGAAVAENATVVVPDVNQDSRYLACSLETRSEIVVPIRKLGYVFGEIDIDSHTPDAFEPSDREVLEEVARLLAALFG
jgi:putative methionine-R-sulfoxide reductase with GAF domain